MAGTSDAPPPDDVRPAPQTPRAAARPVLTWIVVPAILGSLTGILAVVVPWSRYVLALTFVLAGLAWLLRIAGDWIVDHAGPQRGVVLIGTVLFAAWLGMALGPMSTGGFNPIRVTREPKDPYALPPAGSRSGGIPNLKEPGEPIDPVKPFRDLVTPEPVYEPPPPPTPPADGRRGTAKVVLRLSSSQSTYGEGVVLVADVTGDGRTVRGDVEFVADGRVVEQRALRVMGVTSQMEYRLVGLAPGTHVLQVRYRGSQTFAAADSAAVQHRVVTR